jgi:L-alanine-DL-glutamate epimerase-like enolase superfamily enzyme
MELMFAYQEWLYAETFKISRGASTVSPLFVAVVRDGDHLGRGECGVLTQYGETAEDVRRHFEMAVQVLQGGVRREDLSGQISNSCVRNAIDCAMWDLECRRAGADIWSLTGIQRPPSLEVDLTISVNDAEKMVTDARRAAERGFQILKLKADQNDVLARVSAVAAAAPEARLIVDANEAWDFGGLCELAPDLARLGVSLIEQPLPHQSDEPLSAYKGPVPLCADESCRDIDDLDRLVERYQAINIKLDKVGGLTGGLALAHAAQSRGLDVMVGCSGPTSLGAAPAYVLGAKARYLDLDGPALLLDDREHRMRYVCGRLEAPGGDLWGGGQP